MVEQRRDGASSRPGAAVDRDLVEASLVALDCDDPVSDVEALDRLRGDVVRRVDLALLERRDHRVGVVEDPEHISSIGRSPSQ